MFTKKKFCLFIALIAMSGAVYAQFTAPQNLMITSEGVTIQLNWEAPTDTNPVSYNVYANQSFVANVTTLSYTYYPDFIYFNQFCISAVYQNPEGESNPAACSADLEVPAMLELPVSYDFDNNSEMLATSPLNGTVNWTLFTDGHTEDCAVFQGNGTAVSARLYTPPLLIYGYEQFTVSFFYKTPQADNADNLMIEINGENIVLPPSEDWAYAEYSLNEFPNEFHIEFIASVQGENTVYLDTVNLYGTTSTANVEEAVNDVALKSFPNPFYMSNSDYNNRQVHGITISYSTKSVSDAEIQIYNLKGQVVRNLGVIAGKEEDNSITWNCKDDSGSTVSNGIYFVGLRVNNGIFFHKLMLIK
ncbi:MAG: FlgD immunoglobulin-like domain containing protein [Candidatus Cloacimonetes bacterium]|nr:FlgD immunoglobulin-like domain containing protein [Candidatus Cloacimonadota bacterium]